MNIKRFLTKQILVISLSIFCLLAVIISTSYASFTSSSSNVSRTIQSGDLTTTFTNNSGPNITFSPVPLNNEAGEEDTNVYKFTIKNSGDISSSFRIELHSSFSDSDDGLHYLKYQLKRTDSGNSNSFSEEKIIEYPYINIYSNNLSASASATFELRVWLRSSTSNDYQGKEANIKINVKSHVNQAYRGLDEAIKEDNIIRENISTENLNESYYDITKVESVGCSDYDTYDYHSTSYTFDEKTGKFTLNEYNLNDFSSQDTFNDFVYNGTYGCQNASECNELYYKDTDGQCIKYTTNASNVSYDGLYLNNNIYKFIGSSRNNLKYNSTTYQIDSVDADGYITLKNNSSIQSLNWLDLTVSGTGTTNDPYVVYNG